MVAASAISIISSTTLKSRGYFCAGFAINFASITSNPANKKRESIANLYLSQHSRDCLHAGSVVNSGQQFQTQRRRGERVLYQYHGKTALIFVLGLATLL